MRALAAKTDERNFWKLLVHRRRPASIFRLRNVNLAELEGALVQPLEILVADTLAELCPDVVWSVTPVQGDGGIDLVGSADRIVLHLRNAEIRFEYTIVGQVKRSQSYKAEALHGIFGKIRDLVDERDLTLSRLLLVMSAEGGAIRTFAANAPRIAKRDFPGIPMSFIDAEDLVWVWAQLGPDRFEVLRPAYSEAEFEDLKRHLDRRAAQLRRPQLHIEAAAPVGRAVVGGDLDVAISLQVGSAYPRQRLELRFRPGAGIDLIRPLALLSETSEGATIAVGDDGTAHLSLRLRARHAGELDLGTLEVRHLAEAAGTISRPLGTLRVAPDPSGRHVRFVRSANAAAQSALDRMAAAASAGVECVALFGPGGIGKSRIAEELFNRLNPHPSSRKRALWSLVRVDHDTQRRGASFLPDLARNLALGPLASDDPRHLNPRDAVAQRLKRFVAAAAATVDEGMDALDGRGTPELAAFSLATAAIARLRDGPLALHLSNLHWADGFEADVLAQFLQRLAAMESHLPHGLLVVLEGRQGEILTEAPDSTADPWLRLKQSSFVRRHIPVEPWSESESRQFLGELLTSITGIPTRDPGVERRIAELIVRSSAGNPMHMLEHVRWLFDHGYLRDDGDGCLFFDEPPRLPNSLVELISSRVEFLNRSGAGAELLALLRLCAEIGLRCDPDLFAAMTNALQSAQTLTGVSEWIIPQAPAAGSDGFEFQHETYREAFRRVPWSSEAGAALRDAVLARLSPAAAQPPDRAVAAARITLLDPGCDLDAVAAKLEAVLQRYVAEPQAAVALYRELLRLPAHVQGAERRFLLTCRLADSLINYGDWEEALHAIQRGRRELPTDHPSLPLAKAELAYRAGNILGDMHRMAEGIRAVEEGLESLPGPKSQSPKSIALRELLENRLGVLLWFSGRLEEGIAYQYRAYRSARVNDPGGPREMLFANELGMSMAIRYPLRALELLDRATTLMDRLGDSCSPGDDYVKVQREIVRLILAEGADEVRKIGGAALDFVSEEGRSVYGRGLAWLLAGACDMLLGRADLAKARFEEAITCATLCRNLRIRWKAHLAFAAAATAAAGAPRERGHARYAGELLAQSLEGVRPSHRARWAATLRLPLEQARRLSGGDSKLDALIAEIDAGNPPDWLRRWNERPSSLSKPRSREPFQILRVSAGETDIFLMG